ncbi:DUF1080 domain-containing protein [Candidatus Latescibacterota bacterium]
MQNKAVIMSAFSLFLFLGISLPCIAQEKLPAVISALEGQIPSDAIVLFNGTNLSEWVAPDGGLLKKTISKGTFATDDGGFMTKREFGDMQFHIEFATPSKVDGEGQGRGNSGVYLQGIYEIQVLDSYENETYPDGQAGAVYEQYPPLVNVSRPPGTWQKYDIIFHAPKFNEGGKVVKKATVTVLHNGVLIQDNVEIGPTPGGVRETESPKGPIYLQDHKNPVRFRNIWVREL